MFAFEFSVLLAFSALLAIGSLVQTLRSALPQVAGLKQALRDCPETLEVRFTTRAVVVHYNDGKVVPLRPRAAVNQPVRIEGRVAA
jgi:hypothetical protein